MTSSFSSRFRILAVVMMSAGLSAPAAAQAPADTGTPREMVATYQTLADGLLALKATEANLVRSILAAAYAHGEVQLARARKAIAAKDAADTRAALEALAADVAQMATEGDSSVAAVRRKLVDAGQHHNAAGEAQGLYDEGYVIVTRTAKQKLLDASRAIAKLTAGADTAALDAEWKKVQAVAGEMLKGRK